MSDSPENPDAIDANPDAIDALEITSPNQPKNTVQTGILACTWLRLTVLATAIALFFFFLLLQLVSALLSSSF